MAAFNTFKVTKVVLRDKEWKTFESLYGEQKKDNFYALQYSTFFLLHRVLISLFLVFLPAYTSLQIISIITLSFSMLMYIVWIRPFEDEKANQLEIFNQLIVFLGLYSLYVFSNFGATCLPLTQDYITFTLVMKYNFGWFLIASVGLMVAVNSLFILKDMLLNTYSLAKLLLRCIKKHPLFIAKFMKGRTILIQPINEFSEQKTTSNNVVKPSINKATVSIKHFMIEEEESKSEVKRIDEDDLVNQQSEEEEQKSPEFDITFNRKSLADYFYQSESNNINGSMMDFLFQEENASNSAATQIDVRSTQRNMSSFLM